MQIVSSVNELRTVLAEYRLNNRKIGFVPTMGALHVGHAALVKQSVAENDITVVSIFVNPTQFNVQSDFDKYPRTFDADAQIAESMGADVVFAPTATEMYPEGFRTFIEPGQSADPMEGAGRPGHFRGVATIVIKLLNAVEPDVAYFGKKDFQQLAVVTETVQHLNVRVSIVGVETVREPDGLALSSRNVRLSKEARSQAPVIHQALRRAQEAYRNGERNTQVLEEIATRELNTASLCRIEYTTVCDARTLQRSERISESAVLCIAAWFDDVRLIDNIEL
jgi:pantoate--beta-alanine ligase